MIFVNFKTYEKGTGNSALTLISQIESASHEKQIKVIPVIQSSDIKEAVFSTKLEVWAQSIDAVEYGAHTGATLAQAVVEDGAYGTFLNHSERKFKTFGELETAFNLATKAGLRTLIFAGDLPELKRVVELKPNYVSYEPPELVGSKTTSVAQAKPEIIEKAADIARAHDLPLIVGAGIKSAEDIRVSLKLGSVGVAVASDIVLARDPKKEIMELMEGFE